MNQYHEIIHTGRNNSTKMIQLSIQTAPELLLAKSNNNNKNNNTPFLRGDQDPNIKIATITMNDPDSLNSLSPTLMVQLHDTINELVNNPQVRVVIITGAGNAFSAGGNLDLIQNAASAVHKDIPTTPGAGTLEPWRFIRQMFGNTARLISKSNALFIAAINGAAAGVGLAFALACDVLIASPRAMLVPAFGKLGLVPEVGTSWYLTRKLGYHGALSFFLLGQPVDATRAKELLIVNEVVDEHEQLMDVANKWALYALALPPHTVEMSKTLLRSASDLSFDASLVMEEFAEANVFSTRALPYFANKILSKGKL
jgi:2-(1,2-epoxy-1,2-dihydrophenyl)acetyl-CoA isomerase